MRPSSHTRDYQVAKTAKSVLPTQSTWDNKLADQSHGVFFFTYYVLGMNIMNAFRTAQLKTSVFLLSVYSNLSEIFKSQKTLILIHRAVEISNLTR
jgi:hypothetical protein